MEYKDFITKIEEYSSIVIFRHTRPDLDALGSQIGLAEAIRFNYPEKNVYVVGDSSRRYGFIGSMDEVSDEVISNSLAIICDVAVKALVSDDRYILAREVIVLDHHRNDCDISGAKTIVDVTRVACAELIAHILYEQGKRINPYAATALYGGIVTDSGRFQYGNTTPSTFRVAAWLVDCGADMDYIYSNLYVETLKERQMKNFFGTHFIAGDDGVAYMKNDQDILDKFPNVSFFDISRGMVNVMAGIEEIKIWANFTLDPESGKVVGEFRSRGLSIVEIAKKYGGGGHANACGATLDNFAVADLVLNDFRELLKEGE